MPRDFKADVDTFKRQFYRQVSNFDLIPTAWGSVSNGIMQVKSTTNSYGSPVVKREVEVESIDWRGNPTTVTEIRLYEKDGNPTYNENNQKVLNYNSIMEITFKGDAYSKDYSNDRLNLTKPKCD